MCNSISKLYATILDERVHTWAESNKIRAEGQAGFRRGRGTIDNVFILKTLLDQRHHASKTHSRHKTPKLYTCFVATLNSLVYSMFSGEYPDCLSTGILHPIFNSGNTNDPNSYRGIMVCNSISKLYATILDERIHTWAESNNI